MTEIPRSSAWSRIPLELRIFAPFVLVWLAGLTAGLPLSLPGKGDWVWMRRNFLNPLLWVGAAQLGAFVLRRRGAAATLRLLPAFVLALVLHFNFKAWMPFVHPRLYDADLAALDARLAPVVTGYLALRAWIGAAFGDGVDSAYHLLFFGMFYLAIVAHGVLDGPRGQRRLLLGFVLMLLVGGVSYWLVPALGPFVASGAGNPAAGHVQGLMLAGFRELEATGRIPEGYFTRPLAAMPSLHVGQIVLMALCALRSRRTAWLVGIYLPILVFMTVESVASGWHYVVDGPAGALLAVGVFLCVDRWTRDGHA